ncbi:hypothetical protein [Staphylococcus pseudintermedius]|nr:hypothetical protein [Staphylococcus pseudintermedius]EHT8044347.1 hypothetical protein [Staphylococcus pseudintermedius]EIA4931252.1 hypothetical protein [Staphylococcus pseudintermedius]EKF8620110.1 hypothetical protein [Staphylococcus pseudintermedius]MDF0023829.1 hypothetical protein [Staphylococcus pseudintermedius]USE06656.1 hypothetical protein K9E99_12380 [Staphylococcus pseudintermedius]
MCKTVFSISKSCRRCSAMKIVWPTLRINEHTATFIVLESLNVRNVS